MQLAVAFSPPATDGGAFILDYQYAYNGGSFASAGRTTSPITITGLTNGTIYSIQIKAANYIGAGLPSNTVTATPQPTGPVVIPPVEYDPSAGTITVTCDAFTSFTPIPAYSSYYASDQNAAYVESITTDSTNTIVVITQFYSPEPGTVDSTITFGDGVRTSLNSNIFQS